MNLFTKLTAVATLTATLGLAVPGISHAAVGNTELSKGMQNKDVAQLQDVLENRGYLSHLDTKGEFDAKTAEAVKEYQEDHHLSVDGIAGPNTFKAMNLNNTIGAEFLSKGSTGFDVTVLQNKLKSLNYYNGRLDGKFGSKTKSALIGFQDAKNILTDGIAGPDTKSALGLNVVGNETQAKEENNQSAAATETKQAPAKETKQSETKSQAAPQPKEQKQSKPQPKTEKKSQSTAARENSNC